MSRTASQEPDAIASASTGQHRPVWLAGLFAAMFAIGTDEFVIAGVLPRISADLAVSVAATGQLITAFAMTLRALAPGYWPLLVARVGAALAAALIASTSFALSAGAAPDGKRGVTCRW